MKKYKVELKTSPRITVEAFNEADAIERAARELKVDLSDFEGDAEEVEELN